MLVQLGWRYKFTFIDPFIPLNGVYNVTKIYTYQELIQDQIDLNKLLYEPNGKTETEFETDLLIIRQNPIYKLVHVRKEDEIKYIPEHLIALEPDPNVKKYFNSVVTWNIDAFADKDQLDAAQNTISQLIEKLFGTDKSPIIFDIGLLWLTDQEYNEIENDRKTRRAEAFNWFSENQRIRLECDSLKVKCAHLEEIIKNYIANP